MFYWFLQLLKLISTNLFDNEKDRTQVVLIIIIITIFIVTTLISANKFNKTEWL